MDVVQPSAAVESSESFKDMNGKKASEELSPSSRASLDAHGSAGRRLSVDAFDINTPPFNSDHFRMYRMKIERCPKNRPHDWTMCPFLHNGEKAKRRDPRKYAYSATACAEFRKSGACVRGDACSFAHGVFECWLHPARYRTQLCTDGMACSRPVCFFAHKESELRQPGGFLPPPAGIPAAPQLQTDSRASMEAVASQPEIANALKILLQEQKARHEAAITMAAQLLDPLARLRLLQALQQQEQPQHVDTSRTSSPFGNEMDHVGGNSVTNQVALVSALRDLTLKGSNQDAASILRETLSQKMYGDNVAQLTDALLSTQGSDALGKAGILANMSTSTNAKNPNAVGNVGPHHHSLSRRSVDIGALSRTDFPDFLSHGLERPGSQSKVEGLGAPPPSYYGPSGGLDASFGTDSLNIRQQKPSEPLSPDLSAPFVSPSGTLVGSLPTASYIEFASKNGKYGQNLSSLPRDPLSGYVDVADGRVGSHYSDILEHSRSTASSLQAGRSTAASLLSSQRPFDASLKQSDPAEAFAAWSNNASSMSASTLSANPVRRAGSGGSSTLQSIAEITTNPGEEDPERSETASLQKDQHADHDAKRSEANSEDFSSGEEGIGRTGSGSFILDGIGVATSASGSDAQDDNVKTGDFKDASLRMGRIMSFDNLLADMPRSASQVKMNGLVE